MMDFVVSASLLALCGLVAAKVCSDLGWTAFCIVRWTIERKDKIDSAKTASAKASSA